MAVVMQMMRNVFRTKHIHAILSELWNGYLTFRKTVSGHGFGSIGIVKPKLFGQDLYSCTTTVPSS